MTTAPETLRSSWTLDGQRIFLQHDPEKGYRIATRWRWLVRFDLLQDAADAFEALEMNEGDPVALGRHLKTEIQRTPRSRSAGTPHARIVGLADNAERRLRGLHPVACGRKGAVVRWMPARTR